MNKGKGDGGKGKGGTQQAQQVFEAFCNHAWKCGHVEKDCFTLAKREGKGGNNQGSRNLHEAKASNPEDASVGGFGRCSFGSQCDDWNWNKCRTVTVTLDSGAAASAAPKSLGDDYTMKTEEPRSCKTSMQHKGARLLLIGTGDWSQRCPNFRVALVQKALVSTSKVCHKGHRKDKVACITSTRAQGSVCAKRMASTFSTVGFLLQQQLEESGQKASALHRMSVTPIWHWQVFTDSRATCKPKSNP